MSRKEIDFNVNGNSKIKTFKDINLNFIELYNGAASTEDIADLQAYDVVLSNRIDAVDAGPKGVYTTLGDLQTAFPIGDDSIYLVTADGHWYYWSGSAWADGGVYQATAISNDSIEDKMLADDGVKSIVNTLDNSVFTKTATNILDVTGVYVNDYSLRLDEPMTYLVSQAGAYVSPILEVDKDVTTGYVFLKSDGTLITIAYTYTYDIDGNFIARHSNLTDITDAQLVNVYYIRLQFGNTTQRDDILSVQPNTDMTIYTLTPYGVDRTENFALDTDLSSTTNRVTNIENNLSGIVENEGELLVSFADYTTSTDTNVSVSSTTVKKKSTGGITITTTATGNTQTILRDLPLSVATGEIISIFIKIDRVDFSKINSVIITAHNSSTVLATLTSGLLLDGWNCIKFKALTDLADQDIRISIDNNEIGASIILDSVVKNYRLKPSVLLCFDTSQAYVPAPNTYNALALIDGFKPLLDTRGFVGTYALQSGGYPGIFVHTISYAQHYDFLSSGWDYAYYNGNYDTETGGIERPAENTIEDEAYRSDWTQFIDSYRDLLDDKGIFNTVSYFCRFNTPSYIINDILEDNGTKLCRMANSVKTITNFDTESVEIPSIIVTDFVDYPEVAGGGNIADVKSTIDDCIEYGNCVTILCHAVEDGGAGVTASDSSYCSKIAYEEVLDYIKTKVDSEDLQVITYRDLYKGFYHDKNYEFDRSRTVKKQYWLESKIP